MQGIEYIPGGFRIRWTDTEQTMWTNGDLPASVKNGTATEIEAWMTENLPALVGRYVLVKVDSLNPFRFRLALSMTPFNGQIFEDISEGGGGNMGRE